VNRRRGIIIWRKGYNKKKEGHEALQSPIVVKNLLPASTEVTSIPINLNLLIKILDCFDALVG
jgi:hypothetical protein